MSDFFSRSNNPNYLLHPPPEHPEQLPQLPLSCFKSKDCNSFNSLCPHFAHFSSKDFFSFLSLKRRVKVYLHFLHSYSVIFMRPNFLSVLREIFSKKISL